MPGFKLKLGMGSARWSWSSHGAIVTAAVDAGVASGQGSVNAGRGDRGSKSSEARYRTEGLGAGMDGLGAAGSL